MCGPVPDAALLDRRTLNRTLLERQMLLSRQPVTAAQAVERLVGVQAQEPQAPYVGLWSRIDGFTPESLSGLLAGREAVRGLLMRSTLHLVSTRDWLELRPSTQEVTARGFRGSIFGKALAGVELEDLLAHGRRLLAERPLTRPELKARLADSPGYPDPDSLSYAITYLAPVVQVPPRGLWREGGLPRWMTSEAWLGAAPRAEPDPPGLLLRYLRAFGPASVADFQAWSGLTRQAEVADALGDRLIRYRDERGRRLLDLAGMAPADPGASAPVRFLAPFDNVLLGHAERSRIVADEDRAAVNQDRLMRTFLVDGFVAGTWRTRDSRLELRPIRPLRAAERRAVSEEAERLMAFLLPEASARSVLLHDA